MAAKLLDGKQAAATIQRELARDVQEFRDQRRIVPTLAAVLVGDDAASQVYVRSKRRGCQRVGMDSRLLRLPAETRQPQLLETIARLNQDSNVHGILVQLPLPPGLDSHRVLDLVAPLKDVDAFHPENVGLLMQGRARFLPCTPHGVLQLLHRNSISVSGKHVVVIGRSDIVGKPIAAMMMQRSGRLGPEMANATVTVCHSRTQDLADLTRQADILIAAIGQAGFVTPAMVKAGATVVDVGINRTDSGLVGDVEFSSVQEKVAFITPVPGGVGPLTVAMLLRNTLQAAILQHG